MCLGIGPLGDTIVGYAHIVFWIRFDMPLDTCVLVSDTFGCDLVVAVAINIQTIQISIYLPRVWIRVPKHRSNSEHVGYAAIWNERY